MGVRRLAFTISKSNGLTIRNNDNKILAKIILTSKNRSRESTIFIECDETVFIHVEKNANNRN